MATNTEDFLDEQIAGLAGVMALLLQSLQNTRALDSSDLETRLKRSLENMEPKDKSNGQWHVFNQFALFLQPAPKPDPHGPSWLRGVIEGGKS